MHALGDDGRAAACYEESLRIADGSQAGRYVPLCLEGIAALPSVASVPAQALRLLGAAEAQRELFATAIPPTQRAAWERVVAEAWSRLLPSDADAAWAAVRALSLDRAVTEALAAVR